MTGILETQVPRMAKFWNFGSLEWLCVYVCVYVCMCVYIFISNYWFWRIQIWSKSHTFSVILDIYNLCNFIVAYWKVHSCRKVATTIKNMKNWFFHYMAEYRHSGLLSGFSRLLISSRVVRISCSWITHINPSMFDDMFYDCFSCSLNRYPCCAFSFHILAWSALCISLTSRLFTLSPYEMYYNGCA